LQSPKRGSHPTANSERLCPLRAPGQPPQP
jgi:hypothetical protein